MSIRSPTATPAPTCLLTMRAGVEKLAQTGGCYCRRGSFPDGRRHLLGSARQQRCHSVPVLQGYSHRAGREAKSCAGSDLAQAFRSATDAAYKSVGNPVEGTMLTVIRWVAEALESTLQQSEDDDILSLWSRRLPGFPGCSGRHSIHAGQAPGGRAWWMPAAWASSSFWAGPTST